MSGREVLHLLNRCDSDYRLAKMTANVTKAVLELSGGLDSGTLAWWAKDKYQLRAITFNYGQVAAEREISAAKRIAYKLNVPHEIINISGLRQTMMGIINRPYAMLTEAFAPSSTPGTHQAMFCPDSSMTTSIAATYAQLLGFDALLLAVNADDLRNVNFIPRMYAAVEESVRAQSGNENFKIELPFLQLSKIEVIKLGKKLGVPYEDTWSCWWDNEAPCGACPPCNRRVKAFQEAGISDSIQYVPTVTV